MTVSEIAAPWLALDASLGIAGPVRDEAHYQRLLDFVAEAVEEIGDRDDHPLWSLVAMIGDRLRDYENREHPWPETATSASVLAFLITEHGLNQRDLPEVGTQSIISEIMSGKRKLNLRQVKALSARFHVPMDVFVD